MIGIARKLPHFFKNNIKPICNFHLLPNTKRIALDAVFVSVWSQVLALQCEADCI